MRRTELQEPNVSDANRRAVLIVSLIIVGLLILLETLSWLTARAGVFSFLSAASLAHPSPSAQDVDKHGLRIPILLLLWLLAIGAFGLMNVRLALPHRPAWVVLVLTVVAGGFILDGVFGESIITDVMAAEGYSRCTAGDHVTWNGKSHVGFVNYTRKGAVCHSRASG